MHPLESYLRDLHDIRSTGAAVKETSYYPPLANLLNTVGQTLKPRVRCVINLKNQGAGMPDGGLFTPDQLQKGNDIPLEGIHPPAARSSVRVPRMMPGSRPTASKSAIIGRSTAKSSSPTTAISC
jgi:hypothetical protein